MQFTSKILYFFLLTIVWSQAVNSLKGKSPDEAPGVVLLDSITFDKVVPSCTSNVMILFLDKRQIGQPTTDGSRDNFLEVSRGIICIASFLSSIFSHIHTISQKPIHCSFFLSFVFSFFFS